MIFPEVVKKGLNFVLSVAVTAVFVDNHADDKGQNQDRKVGIKSCAGGETGTGEEKRKHRYDVLQVKGVGKPQMRQCSIIRNLPHSRRETV